MNLDLEELKKNHNTSYLADMLAKLYREEEVVREMLAPPGDTAEQAGDESLHEMAAKELKLIQEEKERLEKQVQEILDKDKVEAEITNEIVIEVRAGAGGDEASLFAWELAHMYEKYAEAQGYSWRVNYESKSDLSGYKEASFEVKGKGVYDKMRYETGVHRVQRIPATEKNGRVHTSTASVAVLPIRKKVNFKIDPSEFDMEYSRSGGKGGQNVNKVETAVRIIHKPTGLDVRSTNERSQLANREKAMNILVAKLQQLEEEKEAKKYAGDRKDQIGTADRSEKIRTYNFAQDRVTDHRIKKSWHNLPKILEGEIGDIIKDIQSGAVGNEKEEVD